MAAALLLAVGFGCIQSVSPVMAQQRRLYVSAAISLTNAMQKLRFSTSAAIGTSILPTTGASGALQQQIEQGSRLMCFLCRNQTNGCFAAKTCCSQRLGETC